MQAVPFSLLVAKYASPTQVLISPAFSINSASVPKVMLLFSVQMSGEWYKGRHFCLGTWSYQHDSKWHLSSGRWLK